MEYQGIIITGTSGAGKSTVARKLCEEHKILQLVQAVTTRKPREDDKPQEYKYISIEELEKLDREGKLLIKSTYRSEYYGVTYEVLQQALDNGETPLLVLTPESVEELEGKRGKEHYIFLTIFLDEPDDILNKQLVLRGEKNDEAAKEQRREDREESAACVYTIMNTDVEKTTELIWGLWEYRKTGGILPKRLIQLMIECGMLLGSADINNVRGASYDLSLGDQYWQDEGKRFLDDTNPFIKLKPGDYAIVSSKETAKFPRDIAGRFDLSVGLFCKGIILSNGPQVDPGFKGGLFCLLFNTSDATITLKRGGHYATLEFVKLLEPTIPYSGKHQDKRNIIDYLPNPAAPSAIVKLAEDVKRLKSENRWLKALPIIIAVAMLIVAILALRGEL